MSECAYIYPYRNVFIIFIHVLSIHYNMHIT